MLTSLVGWTRAHFGGLHLMFSFAGYCTMPWPLLDWRPLKTECVSNDLPAALTKLRFGTGCQIVIGLLQQTQVCIHARHDSACESVMAI